MCVCVFVSIVLFPLIRIRRERERAGRSVGQVRRRRRRRRRRHFTLCPSSQQHQASRNTGSWHNNYFLIPPFLFFFICVSSFLVCVCFVLFLDWSEFWHFFFFSLFFSVSGASRILPPSPPLLLETRRRRREKNEVDGEWSNKRRVFFKTIRYCIFFFFLFLPIFNSWLSHHRSRTTPSSVVSELRPDLLRGRDALNDKNDNKELRFYFGEAYPGFQIKTRGVRGRDSGSRSVKIIEISNCCFSFHSSQ